MSPLYKHDSKITQISLLASFTADGILEPESAQDLLGSGATFLSSSTYTCQLNHEWSRAVNHDTPSRFLVLNN